MPRVIAQRELRNDNAAVMKSVEAGESFVITRNGSPVAELRPMSGGSRTFLSRSEVRSALGAVVHIDPQRLRADLDSVADQAPW